MGAVVTGKTGVYDLSYLLLASNSLKCYLLSSTNFSAQTLEKAENYNKTPLHSCFFREMEGTSEPLDKSEPETGDCAGDEVKDESEDEHEMTEEERRMLEPETVIKQEQDDYEMGDRDFSYMTSQRGRRLVVKDDFKYCRSGPMKDGMRYACTKKECRAYLFLNKDETVIVGTQGAHDHPPHASLPPGNSRRAMLGLAPRPYVRKSIPPERKLLPKRNVVPPKHIYTIMNHESPKIKKVAHPTLMSSEEDLKIQTLIAIDEACKDLSSDNSLFGKFTVSEDAKELMTEFIWKKMETYAEDIESFANHASRPVIVEDDVKLLFRRNEPLLERFEHLEIELQQEEEMLHDEFYNHSDVC